MLPLDVRKEIEVLNALTAALDALHAGLLELLEQARRAAGKCVICGMDAHNEECCDACFDNEMSRIMDERKNID